MTGSHPEASAETAALATFTRQLGAMLDADVDVLRALRIASQHVGTERITRAADDIARGMKDGQEFHQAASRHRELFDSFYVEMARQGEADGVLGRALLAVADYLDRNGGTFTLGDVPAAVSADRAPAAVTLAVCGAGALGVAAVWSLVGSGKVAQKWLGPLSALWTGTCLAGGAWTLARSRAASGTVPGTPLLPPKSAARRAAETEGIVRSALQEQHEVSAEGPAEPHAGAPKDSEASPFGPGPLRGLYDPDPSLNRFEL